MDWIETRTIDLPAPVARLVTRAGVGIAGLQRIDYQLPPSGRGRPQKDIGPASLWCFDGALDVRRTIDAPGQLVTLCLDPSATRAGVVSWLDDHASIVQLLSTEEGRALPSRRFDDRSVFGLALHGDLVAMGRTGDAVTELDHFAPRAPAPSPTASDDGCNRARAARVAGPAPTWPA